MNVCSETIGAARMRIMSRPREGGFLRGYYFVVSHDDMPQVTVIRFWGESLDHAKQRFEVSRENALAALTFAELS